MPWTFLFGREADRGHRKPLGEQVRRYVLRSLKKQGRLPLFEEVVAAIQAGSGSTVRWTLATQGTSYREIMNNCRREQALELLARSGLSIEAISSKLDFCDGDAFRAAFRQWVGTSPSKYRSERVVGLE